MSSSNSTVVIKTFQPSQKEEKLRNKLYANGGQASTQKRQQNQMPINKPARSSSQQSVPQNQQSSNQTQPLQNQQQQVQQSGTQATVAAAAVQSSFNQIYNQIPDQKVDLFLKQMENELTNINKKQVSIGMLNSQAQILKEQNELLNDNQKQLAVLMHQLQNEDKLSKQKNELIEENKKVLQSLLAPLNDQIQEVKSMYESAKRSQKDISFQMNKQIGGPGGVQSPQLNQNIQDFQKQNSSLKNKLDTVAQNLNEYLPENMNAIANMTNFNIDIYSKTINNLKNQILELQHDAQKAEIELEERQQKLNRLPKQQEMLIPYQENVLAQVENIDFVSSYQIVNNKLGGEFDYDSYSDTLSEITTDMEVLWRSYQQALVPHAIHIPKINLTQNEINDLSYKMPSVLDDIKERIGLDPSKPMKNPNQRIKQREQEQTFIDMARQDPDPVTNYAKHQTLKPKNLQTLKSQPIACPRDIAFEKKEQPSRVQYDTLFQDKSAVSQQKNSMTNFGDISRPAPFPKITSAQGNNASQMQQYPKSNVSSMTEMKRKQSYGSNQKGNTSNLQGQHQKRKSNTIKSLVDRDMDEELNQYQDEVEEQYENYLQIQMDKKIVQNLTHPYKDEDLLYQKSIPPEELVQIQFANNQLMQQQPMDRETLKSIFLEVLQENKQQIFGNLLDQQNQNPIQRNSIQNLNREDVDPSPRSKLSELIDQKDNKEIQTSFLKNSTKLNLNSVQQNRQNTNVSAQSDNQNGASIQQQSQDLALNFLNVINSTLASVNQAVNKTQQNKQNKVGLDIEEISEGSIDDDSMEAGIAQMRKGQKNQNTLQQNTFGGVGQNTFQNFNGMPQQPFGMTLNPYQMQQQQMMMMGGGGNMPMPIYPGMMMPATWMMPPQQPFAPMNQTNKQGDDMNDTRINLKDYYREFQLSDTDTVANQSNISMSQYDAKSNRSYADSIFYSQDNSRSEGQVSVPGRKSVSNIKVQNQYYPGNNKSALSQGELSQSHEISQDYSRRRSVDKNNQYKKNNQQGQSNKYVGDDIWKDISDEYSAGQI